MPVVSVGTSSLTLLAAICATCLAAAARTACDAPVSRSSKSRSSLCGHRWVVVSEGGAGAVVGIDAHREDIIILFGGEVGVISDEARGRRGLYLYLRCVRFSTHRP